MGLSMMFYYRRNLNGVPMSIQRAMPKQADESDDTHQTHNWITQMDDKDLDALLATCLCVIIVSVLGTIYMIWRIIALFVAYT